LVQRLGAHGVPIDMVKKWLIEAKLGFSNASEDLKALDPLAWEEANHVFLSTLVRPWCICTLVNLSFPASAKRLNVMDERSIRSVVSNRS